METTLLSSYELWLIIALVASVVSLVIEIVVIYSIISANKHLEHIEEFCDWYYETHKGQNKSE